MCRSRTHQVCRGWSLGCSGAGGIVCSVRGGARACETQSCQSRWGSGSCEVHSWGCRGTRVSKIHSRRCHRCSGAGQVHCCCSWCSRVCQVHCCWYGRCPGTGQIHGCCRGCRNSAGKAGSWGRSETHKRHWSWNLGHSCSKASSRHGWRRPSGAKTDGCQGKCNSRLSMIFWHRCSRVIRNSGTWTIHHGATSLLQDRHGCSRAAEGFKHSR